MKGFRFILGIAAAGAALSCAAAAYADSDMCVAAVYKDGALYSCAKGEYKDGAVFANVRLPDGEYTAKAFFTDKGTVEIEKGKLNPIPDKGTPPPSVTAAPAVSPEPTAAPAKTPRPTYHPAYETEKDAVEAFAVVTKVNAEDADGELKHKVTAFCRAQETVYMFDEDEKIASAPDAFSSLTGESVSALKKGDVITVTCTPSGSVKSVDLVIRVVDSDIVTGGGNYGGSFEKLFSRNGVTGGRWRALAYGSKLPSDASVYVFGVIRGKDGGSVVLVNKDGKDGDAFYIDLSPDVIVYTCDVSEKNEIAVGGAGDIQRSGIAKADMDDDDNVTVWHEDAEYSYALVRVVDGTAVEAVVYTGYNE